MNNDAFRNLLASSSSKPNGASQSLPPNGRVPALGSRKSGFMSMAPRNVRSSNAGAEFARQVAERKAGANTKTATKSGSKGMKLGKGYQDRALERLKEDDAARDEREEKIAALAKQVKEGKLEMEEFERLREEIAGGELESTHLVKGLDRKLLDRIRKGEDVYGEGEAKAELEDVDDEFEDLAQKEVQAPEKETVEKKGHMVSPPPVAGVKRSRNDILKELKAKRQAEMEAKQAARPELDARFKSIESKTDKPKVKVDSKGREVIITRDENGRVKKKYRKVDPAAATDAIMPEAPRRFLDEGIVAPVSKQVELEEVQEDLESGAMFDDVSDDYNPLGDLPSDDDDDDDDDDDSNDGDDGDEEEGELKSPEAKKPARPTAPAGDAVASNAKAGTHEGRAKPRNYFTSSRDKHADGAEPAPGTNPFQDPAFLSAISRAGNLAKFRMRMEGTEETAEDAADESEDEESRIERLDKEARLKKKREMLLSNSTRDLDDMDLGFGGGRFDEDEDGGDEKIKLSQWREGGGDGDGDDGPAGKGKKEKRKRNRGPKKGNKNDAKDVMEVLKRRQG